MPKGYTRDHRDDMNKSSCVDSTNKVVRRGADDPTTLGGRERERERERKRERKREKERKERKERAEREKERGGQPSLPA